jgi:hypothetical protein
MIVVLLSITNCCSIGNPAAAIPLGQESNQPPIIDKALGESWKSLGDVRSNRVYSGAASIRHLCDMEALEIAQMGFSCRFALNREHTFSY